MTAGRRRMVPAPAPSAVLLLLALLGSPPSVATAGAADATPIPPSEGGPGPDAPERRIRIVATLQAVDAESQTIWLVTGTGFALRALKAEVAPSCQIKMSGSAARLADLKPGQVVRTECLESLGRLVAVVIETVPAAPETTQP